MTVCFCIREVPDEVYKSLDAVGEGENWWEVIINIPYFRYLFIPFAFSTFGFLVPEAISPTGYV